MYLSIEFQEDYKRLDRLCKDYLSSNEGVSEYIRQMESTSWNNRRNVYTWEDDYKQLKHVRWLRNQLAHEVGTLDSGLCTPEDLKWVKSFYNRIINGNDPFTIIRKAKEEQAHRAKQQAQAAKQQAQAAKQNSDNPLKQAPQKTSFWNRLIANIKDFFA